MDWLPDESELSGVSDLTVADVAAYAARYPFDPSGEIGLLQSLGLSDGDLVVEFGAGPGAFAAAAARVAGSVVAVDPSPAMCGYLRQRAAEAGIANLAVVEAGFLSYEHAGPPAGYVFSRNALHHLPDHWKAEALVRVRRLLRPGGWLRLRDLVYGFPPDEAGERVARWLDTHSDADGWTREQLASHVRDEHSTYTWLLEPMLERAGFDIVDRSTDETGFFASYSCRRR